MAPDSSEFHFLCAALSPETSLPNELDFPCLSITQTCNKETHFSLTESNLHINANDEQFDWNKNNNPNNSSNIDNNNNNNNIIIIIII